MGNAVLIQYTLFPLDIPKIGAINLIGDSFYFPVACLFESESENVSISTSYSKRMVK